MKAMMVAGIRMTFNDFPSCFLLFYLIFIPICLLQQTLKSIVENVFFNLPVMPPAAA